MIRFLTIPLLLLVFLTSATEKNGKTLAYEKKTHSVYLSYGLPSILLVVGPAIGPITGGYEYQVNRWFGVGGHISYSSAKGKEYTYSDNNGPLFNYQWHASYLFGGVHGSVYWLNKKDLALYSGLSLGYVKVTVGVDVSKVGYLDRVPGISISGSSPMVCLDIFGVKYKASDNVSMFGEVGLLAKGVVNFGVQYSFLFSTKKI